MALKIITRPKNFTTDEAKFRTGQNLAHNNGTLTPDYVTDFAGEPHGGEATIEMWGAGGSGARMCCCGGGIPGNAAGYSKTYN